MGDVRERAIQAGAEAISKAWEAAGPSDFPSTKDDARAVLEAEGVAYFDLIDTLAVLCNERTQRGRIEARQRARALLARLGGNA